MKKLGNIIIKLMAMTLIFGCCSIPRNPIQIGAGEDKTKIFIIGDSKSSHYFKNYRPRQGWGEEILENLKDGDKAKIHSLSKTVDYKNVVQYETKHYRIENWGKAGKTLRYMLSTGQMNAMLKRVKKGSYVMVAFGHNDARMKGANITRYRADLRSTVSKIKKKGAHPILVTTPPKNFSKNKKVYLNANNYRLATISIAHQYNASLVDLNQMCVGYFNMRGKKVYNNWYMKYKPGQVAEFPKGLDDNTHFNVKGAKVLARMLCVELESDTKLKGLRKFWKVDTRDLRRTFYKARSYERRHYTKKTWDNMIKARKHARITLYTPGANKSRCSSARQELAKALKGLKRHG